MKDFKSIAEMEKEILEFVNQNETIKSINLEINDYDLSDITNRVKRNFLSALIKRFNVWKVERHNFKENVKYGIDFNFAEIEQQVKTHFEKLTKADRIKEVMPYLYLEKYFNQEGKRFFSLWDLSKTFKVRVGEVEKGDSKLEFDTEKARTEISKEINDKKEVCISFYGKESYHKPDSIKRVFEFLYLACDLNTLSEENTKELNLKELDLYENNEVKIKFCKEWAYITIADQEKQNKLKSLMVEETLKRMEKQ